MKPASGFLAVSIFHFALFASNSVAHSATASASFAGTVLSLCTLIVATPGTIQPNYEYTELSSDNSGGTTASVEAITTGTGYSVTTEAHSNFTISPSGGGTSVTFSSSYSTSGATTVGLTSGTGLTSLSLGLTNVAVHLSATKSTGTFPAGAYTAEVLVRCE